MPALAQQPAPRQLDRAEVIGTSPLPGQGIDRNLLPYDTQVVRRGQLDAAGSDNVTDFLSRRLPGLQVNDIQGSPFQADLTFRGFRASGLIGASQGISVYLDGVRINEPFGDVVNWDLIPEFSVASLTLVPGANPAFGLNTIGGALSFTTLSGLSAPGLRADVGFGSFGRKRADASYGRSGNDGWHQYAGITLFDERGWRDFSDGNLAQAFIKLGRESGATSWDLGLLAGRSTLVGNGLVPAYTIEDGVRTDDLYAARREAIYTHPDKTRNELLQLAFNARHRIDASTLLSGLVYARGTRRSTVNGDTSDADVPAPDENASLNSSRTRQTAGGVAAALSKTIGEHQLQFGASVDASRVRFRQQEQEGRFDATRGVIAGDEEPELSAEVSGRSIALGLYATDTWRMLPSTHVTATLRANHARVSNTLTSVDDDTGEVEQRPKESFRYNALNPALGIAHRLGGNGITLFANAARNNRVPTVIELGCADPDEPCRLPAGLQSDPFLKQVKSTTVEAGARWTPGNGTRASIAAYRTDNRDDILFGSVSLTGQLGFFRNFPRTRHQGIDAQIETTLGARDAAGGIQPSRRHVPGRRHAAPRRSQRRRHAGHAHRRPAARHLEARCRLERHARADAGR